MTHAQALHFYAVTPIYWWPVLWLNLIWVRRWMAAAQNTGRAGWLSVRTDYRGRLFVHLVDADAVPAGHAPQRPYTPLTYSGARAHELADLDWQSRAIERQDRAPRSACARPLARPQRWTALAYARLEPG